jgi:DNA-binding response OmpR family regulator
MPKKILIIDDEEDMRIYLQVMFNKAGFDTALANNGEEALEIIDGFTPDLITLDIVMPKKSGINFFNMVRERNDTKELPIIVLSGVSGNKDFFEDGSRMGPTVFVEKPIDPDSLLKKVYELLGE